MLTIEQLREQIQETDHALIRNLAHRQDLCKKIARLKRQEGKAIIDRDQEKKNFELYESLSKRYAIDPEFVERLFKRIVIHSRNIQQNDPGH